MKKNKLLKLTGIAMCLVMLCAIGVMAASATTVIDTVHVYGIDAPVPGTPPDFAGEVGNPAYCIMYGEHGVYWRNEDNKTEMSCESYSGFAEGVKYSVKVYIEPEAGYAFPDNPSEITAYFGAGEERVFVYKDSNGYYVQQHFDKCGEIYTIALTTKVPEAGQKPDYTAVWDGRYYSDGKVSPERNGVKWYDETAERYLISGTTTGYFEEHHTYTVTYSIYAVDGCDFNGSTIATVNGKRAEVLCDNNGGAIVKYTFYPECELVFNPSNFPSCNGTGNIGYYVCSCGDWFWDELRTQPITDKEEVVIPPTGAHVTTLVNAKAATCSAEGYTGDKVCSVASCKAVVEKGKTIPKKAHTAVKDAAVAATYKKEGKTEGSHCKVCGYVIKSQTVVAKKALPKVKGLKTKSVVLASGSKTKLTLTWTKISGVDGYEVQQYISKKWKTVKKITKNTNSYTVTGLTANKSYKFRVRAVADKYKGGYSSVFTAKAVPLTPSVTLKAGKKQLTASWNTVANITGFEVQYSTSKKFTKKTTKTVVIKKSKTKKTTVKKLSKGKKYYVKVRAYKSVGKTKIYSAWSSIKYVKVK